jgi:hypothetical protein
VQGDGGVAADASWAAGTARGESGGGGGGGDSGAAEAAEVEDTERALLASSQLCSTDHALGLGYNDAEQRTVVETLQQELSRHPVVSMGVLSWVHAALKDRAFVCGDRGSASLGQWRASFLRLVGAAARHHPLQWPAVFRLLRFAVTLKVAQSEGSEADSLKRGALEQMVRLMCEGFVIPVVAFMHLQALRLSTDQALLRHFVQLVLERVEPPYSAAFVAKFAGLLAADSVKKALSTLAEDKAALLQRFKAQVPRELAAQLRL